METEAAMETVQEGFTPLCDGTTCHYNSVGKRPAGYEGTLLFLDPGSRQTTKRRKSEKQVRHVEGAAARATGSRANETSSHSAGAAELATFDVELAGVHAEERTWESEGPRFFLVAVEKRTRCVRKTISLLLLPSMYVTPHIKP